MTVIVIAVLFLIAATRTSKPAPGGMAVPSVRSGALADGSRVSGVVQSSGEVGGGYARSVIDGAHALRDGAVVNPRGSVTAKKDLGTSPERCPSARNGLRWYHGRYAEHRAKMGLESPESATTRRGRVAQRPSSPLTCPHIRYLAARWRTKAYAARVTYERWAAVHVLRDPEVRPGNDAWEKAVQRVQRVFPGTASWLWSCSAAEGGHGRWVRYGGGSYYPGYEYTDAVGGFLQFRFSTHRGMFRRAAEYAQSRGFRLPMHLRDETAAWRSALGQALAGAWARFTGNDNSHWSASWGNGC